MIVVLGSFAGCTAIIDGAENAPDIGTSMAHGSQPPTTVTAGTSGGQIEAPRGDAGDATAEERPLSGVGGAPGSSSGGQPAEAAGDGGVGGRREVSGGAGNSGAQAAGASGEGGAPLVAGGAPSTETAGGAAGSASPPSAGGPLPAGEPAHGHQLVALSNCYRCHGDNLAGRGFYRNITPDIDTGIGSWTDNEIADAVRGAIGPTGELFCASMPLFSGFKDQDIADVIAYLRLIPAVTNEVTSVCPGHNP